MVGTNVARRTQREIDGVVGKKQGGARIFVERIEIDTAVGLAGTFTGDRGFDFYRAAELFRAGGDCEGMEPLLEIVGLQNAFAFLGAREDVDGAGLEIDDRSGGDTHFWSDEETAGIAFRDRRDVLAGIGEMDVAERSGG